MTRAEYHALRRMERDSLQAYRMHILNCLNCCESLEEAKRTAPPLLMVCPRPHVMGSVGQLIRDQAQRRSLVLTQLANRKRWEFQRQKIAEAPLNDAFKAVTLAFIGPRPTPQIRRIAA